MFLTVHTRSTIVLRPATAPCTWPAPCTAPSPLPYPSSASSPRTAGLTAVNLPASLETIKGWAFVNCTRLQFVSFGSPITFKKPIGLDKYEQFKGCTALAAVSVPNAVTAASIPGGDVFKGCSRTRVQLHRLNTPFLSQSFELDFLDCGQIPYALPR